MTTYKLAVHQLTLEYHEPPVKAVCGVSFGVEQGKILALLGQSGSGKSSLLRAIAGLAPARGQILVDGVEVSGIPPHKRNIGMVFQDAQLFAHRNVERNIAYGLEVHGWKRTARKERVAQLLEVIGLEGYQRRSVSTLSGGQAQRVALARTLAPRPEVVLLDEPLSALDRVLRTRLSKQVRQIIRSQNATALYVTHDREEARRVADLIGVMHEGKLVALGSYPELAESEHPAVRELLGE